MGTLKFRILLDTEDDSEIFRDIKIDENDTFESLYNSIITAFRFEGDQMASFYMSNDEWDKGHEISLMDMNYGDEAIDEIADVMSGAVLREFMETNDQKVILVYDFIRMWIFLIELVERTEEILENPIVTLSIGIAPPEDSRMIDMDDDEDLFGGEEDEDEFGMDEFDDGFNEEDYSSFDEYDY